VGFDRERNEFVLNRVEFRATLLRVALLAFCGPAYGAYSTAASKFELLLFMLDQSEALRGDLQFRGFQHAPTPDAIGLHSRGERRSDPHAPPYDTAVNLGRTFWERTQATPLGVKALLEGQGADGHGAQPNHQSSQLMLSADAPAQLLTGGNGEDDGEAHLSVPSAPLQSLPQDWGHGARSYTAIVTAPTPGAVPANRFNTSTSVPRAPFATTMLEPFQPTRHTNAGALPGNPPSRSPTKGLFARTPFQPDKKRGTTKFSANAR